MKRIIIWAALIMIVANIIATRYGLWNLLVVGRIDLREGVIITIVELVFLAVSYAIPVIILNSMVESEREFTGTVVDKEQETDTTTTFIPISSGNSTMLLPMSSSSESFSLSIKASDGKIYECECSEEEYDTAKKGDRVVCIESIRKSGSVYYSTK